MEKTEHKNIEEKKKNICYKDGRIYFTKAAERKVFFFLTIFMLTLGVMSFAGFF